MLVVQSSILSTIVDNVRKDRKIFIDTANLDSSDVARLHTNACVHTGILVVKCTTWIRPGTTMNVTEICSPYYFTLFETGEEELSSRTTVTCIYNDKP